ncbi:MAG: hypothetical protein BGO98_48955 [Myxococcales bacterium 68-20]|nr:hypothetical protein [Myxococcales bacterium]OJY29756.1 MAG: hypothetical protein BGO98_48955 [Myxococcales bacterium 68-20]
MPLDEATRKLAISLERELRRLLERERARADRGEQVRYDSVSRMATWETRRGDVIGRWYGDVIARYVVRDRLLRWAWAGRSSISTMTHAELVSREGQSRGVPQLAMSVVGDLDEDDARTLARLAVVVAKGEGVELRRTEEEITFIGLFDSPRPREGEAPDPSRYSVPPPPAARRSAPPLPLPGEARSSPPARRTTPPPVHRSLPPIREIYEPRSARSKTPPPERKIREPARSLFLPVATAVLGAFAKAVPGYQQALFVLTVDRASPSPTEKRRLVVLLAANDASGSLRAVDPSHEVVDAAARLVEADQNDGNGPWRKLSARITPKPDGGATLNVDVI